MPAPATSSGNAPLSEETTGVPQAIASAATRPNCSFQDRVVNDGIAMTSTDR
ncbi:MAG: hypothetical protein V9G19_26850 [Tetrasphaera sp.]